MGLERNKLSISNSVPSMLTKPKVKMPKREFTPQLLEEIKAQILANEEMEKSRKPVKFTSSFLSTSRKQVKVPNLCYISKGLKESPSVGKYTPRDINLLKQPKYSFSKNRRDTNLFLFAERAGSHVLFENNKNYANFDRPQTCRNSLKNDLYKTTIKFNDTIQERNSKSRRRTIHTARSKRRIKNIKNLKIQPGVPNLELTVSRPKTAMHKTITKNSCSFKVVPNSSGVKNLTLNVDC